MKGIAIATVFGVTLFAGESHADETAPVESEPLACLSRWYDATVDGSELVLGKTKRVPLEAARATFAVPYRPGPIRAVTDPNEDPGRTRLEALFDATYGDDPRRVESALVPVRLGPLTVRVHRKVAAPLRRVAARLDVAERALQRSGGTFVWRSIAGTNDRSTHSWGIAIDLDPALSDYWRNARGEPHWKNRIPQVIVDAFEAEGFIWGGRWYHYDTMHFEYRPELLAEACQAPHAHR